MLEQLGKQAKEASIILGKAGIEDKIIDVVFPQAQSR